MKLPLLVAVPSGVVTVTVPVAPAATMAVIWVAESTVKLDALVPPNVTAVAPVKLVPVMVTDVPVPPDVGEKDVMVGAAKVQLVLFPFETLFVPMALMAVEFVLLESLTSRYAIVRSAGLINHWVPDVLLLRDNNCSLAPLRLRVFSTVVVVPLGKVRVAAEVIFLVRLLKIVDPDSVWLVPSRVTVPLL